MNLRFTNKALEDLERLHDFVARKNPAAAGKISRQLTACFQTLLKQPFGGKPLSSLPVRQWVTGDYIVRYLIEGEETLIIIRVWHGREDRPS